MSTSVPVLTATAPASARRAFAALVAGAVAIAFAGIFVRLSEVGPTATAFHRMLLALPVLWLWLRAERRGPPAPTALRQRDRLGMVAAGLLFAGDLALWHLSLLWSSVANATLFANVAPIFVTLGAWLLFGQRVSGSFLLALALAMLGAAILMGDSVSLSPTRLAGDALGVGCAVFYAGYLLCVGQLRARLSTATIMTWSAAASAAVLLPIAVLAGEPLLPSSLRGWSVLLGLALFSHVGGQSLIAYGLAHLSATYSALVLLVQPVVAALAAWALLAEPLSLRQGIGAAIILAAIAWGREAVAPRSASGRRGAG